MFLVSCALLALTVYQKPNESLMTIGLMCLGLPVYVVGVSWKKPAQVRNVLSKYPGVSDDLIYFNDALITFSLIVILALDVRLSLMKTDQK